jgi:hypothetical protein
LTIDHRLREHRALVVIERREQTDLGQERWSTDMRLGYPVVSRHVSMDPVGARRGVLPPGAREGR